MSIEGTNLVDAAPVFAALGDPTRLRIVAHLCTAGPLSIVRLTGGAHITRQAVTKHLNLLARAGLVRSTRDGRERVWAIAPQRIADVHCYLEMISTEWGQAIDRLRTAVETQATGSRSE